jgi:hypothetical protein
MSGGNAKAALGRAPLKLSETERAQMRKSSLFLILGLMAAVAVVIIVNLPRAPAYRINKLAGGCQNNLRIINSAKEEWALENRKTTNDPPPTLNDLRPYMGRGINGELPECLCGGTYTPGRLDESAKCSLTPDEHTYERKNAYEAKRQKQ